MSFDDLHLVARGRPRTPEEVARERAMTQDERNALVRTLAAEAGGRIVVEDRVGTDGVTYAAFRRADGPAPECADADDRPAGTTPA